MHIQLYMYYLHMFREKDTTNLIIKRLLTPDTARRDICETLALQVCGWNDNDDVCSSPSAPKLKCTLTQMRDASGSTVYSLLVLLCFSTQANVTFVCVRACACRTYLCTLK